jgi:hypothetical protein
VNVRFIIKVSSEISIFKTHKIYSLRGYLYVLDFVIFEKTIKGRMGKMALIAVLLFSTIGFAQNKNFVIEDKLIVWKLVYEDSTNISELRNNLRLEFITDSMGHIKKTNFENKKLNQLSGEFKIESKKGKYRITVFNIKFFVEPIGLYSGGMSMQTISEYTIEKSLMKKNGTIRESSLGYNLTETLNPHFIELFTIKKTIKSEW